MQVTWSFAAFCVVALVARTALADGSPTDLAGIIHGLASDQSAIREAAKRELAQVPAAQLNDLRAALASMRDDELASLVFARIRGLENYAALHPPGLSVDLKDADWPLVIRTLNAQLGGNYLSASGAGGHVTLAAKDQSLWEILRQINEQASFAVETPKENYPFRKTNWYVLHPLGGGVKASPIAVTDGLGIRAAVRGNPATGTWMVECALYVDPRILVLTHGMPLQLESAEDQAGRKLTPLHSNSTSDLMQADLMRNGTYPPFTGIAAFEKSGDVKAIKQIRGKVNARILVAERTLHVDLARQLASPMETPLGMATFKVDENGAYAFKMYQSVGVPTPHMPQMGRSTEVRLRVNDENKQVMQEVFATGSPSEVHFRGHDGARAATTIDLVFPDAAIDTSLPIELKDLPVASGRDEIP